MAPDLNSVPLSPRNRIPTTTSAPPPTMSPSSSRRTSVMGPPPVPQSPTTASASPAMNHSADNTGVGLGPGPLRHPQPLTAADLHLQMEKEQEAAVNRLTRELSNLRQQTASVVSTASSTSDILVPPPGRHRSSSNVSTRSITNPATTGNTSVSGVAPARDSAIPPSRPSGEMARGTSLSREPSVTSRHSGTSSPVLSSSIPQGGFFTSVPSQTHRQSLTAQPSEQSGSQRTLSFSSAIASARMEEAAFHRAELDAVKRENEALRQKIRELEASLRRRRSDASAASRDRAQSTTTDTSSAER